MDANKVNNLIVTNNNNNNLHWKKKCKEEKTFELIITIKDNHTYL